MEEFARHFSDPCFEPDLLEALRLCLPHPVHPIWVCIGSDRHILDCFGPMTGAMLRDYSDRFTVYGTLDQPVDAKNLTYKMEQITNHASSVLVAIDASLGEESQIGMIKLKKGPLLPGKALSRKLPPIGDISITGIMGKELNRKNINSGSISNTYFMAQKLSRTIWLWQQANA